MPGRMSYRSPRLLALLSFLLLSSEMTACTERPTANSAPPLALTIDVGRIGAILDKADEILAEIASSDEENEAADAMAQLKSHVFHYNIVLMKACGARQIAGEMCSQVYLPAWLNDRPNARHGEAALRGMLGEAQSRIMPLWTAICEKGKAAGDEHACDME